MSKPKDNKTQIERFKEAARELETDDSAERFDQIVKSLAKKSPKNDSNTDSNK